MEQELSMKQIYLFLRRNIIPLTVIPAACVVLSVYTTTLLTPQFKSKATIEIKSSYFKNPLVSDLISEEHDPAELRSQRGSMIRKALNDEFVENIGQEFGLFSNTAIPKLQALERQQLKDSIEFYAMGPNTFELTVTSSPREQAKGIAERAVSRITSVLRENRISHLKTTRDALENHVQDLSKALRFQKDDKSNQTLEEEFNTVQDSIALLLTHFTASHPSVQKLQNKAKLLEQKMKGSPKSTLVPPEIPLSNVMASPVATEPVKEVHDSLVRKLSDVSLALSVEESKASHLSIVEAPTLPVAAVFPSKRNFALFGAIVGALLSGIVVAVRELNVFVREDPEQIAEDIGLPLLGQLPVYKSVPGLLLLEGRKLEESPKLLAWKSSTSHDPHS